MESQLKELEAQGWSLNPQAVQQALEEQQEEGSPPLSLKKAVLDMDLTKVGSPVLPTDINMQDSKKLAGPHVLQVVSMIDTSQPGRLQELNTGNPKSRMLRLVLTDGKQKCTAVEYQHLDGIKKEDLIPGTKVKIQGCTIKVGIVLLTSKSVQVLGGRVEHLAEAYEVQEKYGGTAERTKTDTDVAPPPRFQHYDAKKAGKIQKEDAKQPEPYTATVAHATSKAGRGRGRGRGGSITGPPGLGGPSTQPFIPPPPPVAAVEQPTAVESKQPPPQVPGNDLAKAKLLEKLQANTETNARYGRGGGRGGGRRGRRRFDDEDDGTSMTLEEYEATQKPKITLNTSISKPAEQMTDEELARMLQDELDIEDQGGDDLQSSLLQGMFSYDRQEESHYRGRGGRRGGRRGGGGRGRGRGRGR